MRLSLVTACFNAETTIADTVRSVGRQVGVEVEHLIMDGASHDATVAVARSCAHPGVRIFSEPDAGVYDAMNRGIALATGEVIGFLNADDYLVDERVLATVARPFQDPRVDAVFGDLEYITPDDARVVRYWRSSPYRPGAFARGWLPPHPTFFTRRSVYQCLGDFDLSYGTAADFDLMNRFFTRGRIRSVYLPKTLVRMRIGGVSNRSWKAIAYAQVQNARSLIATIGMVPPTYPFLKLADRLRQYRRARRRTGLAKEFS
jgi:glycosyltransferase involved in cell wall biosynthesis